MEQAIWLTTLSVAACAAVWDFRHRLIPNTLTFSGLLLGLTLNGFANHWQGLRYSLEGAALALALLLPLVLLRGLGAGDWKLMGALGALLGPSQVTLILLLTVFMSGFVAVGQIAAKKRVWQTLANVWELARGFFVFGLVPNPEIRLDNHTGESLPFGLVAGVATLFCFWLRRPG